MAIMKKLTNGKYLWMRTIGSTIIGEFLDSAIFIAIASLTGVFLGIFLESNAHQFIFKVSIEVLFTPVTYWFTRKLKQAEGADVFSDLKDLSPLSF